jgi:inhibitor of KinA sporulation pathway (predicted exonuclease)
MLRFEHKHCVAQERRKYMINTLKIKGRLVEMGLTQKNIADKDVWGCALPTVSQKLNGVRPVCLDEADALARLLKLSQQEYYEFFFGNRIA